MIESIHIKRFQSHDDSKFILSPGVSIFVGNSDSGKSSVIRAIKWCAFGRPLGDSIRSTWGGETSVEMVVDGNVVTRSKDKVDKYQIQAEGEDIQEFKAIGTSVPEEVDRILGINTINLQYQLDAPFLLSDTPGQVAEFFNKVAKLEKIDTGIANVNSAIRSLESDIKYKTAEVVKQEEQLKGFEYLDLMEKDVRYLEELDKILHDTVVERGGLENIIEDIYRTEGFIEVEKQLLSLEKDVLKIEKDIEKKNELELKLGDLGSDVYDYIEVDKEIEQQDKLLKLEDDVLNILDLKEDLHLVEGRQRIISKLLFSINNYNTQLKRKVSEIALFEAEFEKEMGTICVLCGQTINKNHGTH